ncbi:MAG: hypothetical protein KGJ95_06120, partial [Candidatus Omnitrophica bacterium]|nr:hypothetical protein [Candidatus Omnitrophota bacterium]
MNSKDECLSLASWPSRDVFLVDIQADVQMQSIIEIITAIRNIRAQWNIKPNETVNAFYILDGVSLNQENLEDIKRLARLKDFSSHENRELFNRIFNMEEIASERLAPIRANVATALVGTTKIFVPLEGLVNLEAEKKRMNADIVQKKKSVDGLNARLNNTDFVSKAPEEVIIKEKERLGSLIKEISALEGVLANLS